MTPNEALNKLAGFQTLIREHVSEDKADEFLVLLALAEDIHFNRGYWTGYGSSPDRSEEY